MAKQQRRPVPEDLKCAPGEAPVKPSSRLERKIRSPWAALGVILRASRDPEVKQNIRRANDSGQGIAKRIERIWSAKLEGATRELHTARTLNDLGIRVVDCECSPGMGHNARP